jgi:hypothetical protein
VGTLAGSQVSSSFANMSKIMVAIEGEALWSIIINQYIITSTVQVLVSEFVLWAEKIQLSVNLCMWHNTIIAN